jgi:hypothetical protein
MPINNTLKLPYFLEALLKKRLIDIDVSELDKTTNKPQNPMQPESITIIFKNGDSYLQLSCLEIFPLSFYTDNVSLRGKCSILIRQYKKLLKDSNQLKSHEQEEKLTKLQDHYLKLIRQETFNLITDTQSLLQQFNPKFPIGDTLHTCAQTKNMELAADSLLEVKRAIEIAQITMNFFHEARRSGLALSKDTPEAKDEPFSTPSIIDLGKYSPDLQTFITECQRAPIKKTSVINEESLLCRVLLDACEIPVRVNDKIYDLVALEKLDEYFDYPFFEDPVDRIIVYKFQIQAARDIRTKTQTILKEQELFADFVAQHKKLYDQARFFKRSKFAELVKSGKIYNFEGLLRYVAENPGSRAAKLYVDMKTPLSDTFTIFVKKYLRDYQSSYFFKSSNILKKIQTREITTYDEVCRYGGENPGTRTARLTKS